MFKILIADDFKLLREVIRMYLERVDDIVLIDEAPDLMPHWRAPENHPRML